MATIRSKTILHRLPDLKVSIDSSNQIQIILEGRTFEFGPHALAILDAFSQPCFLSQGLENLQTRIKGKQDWKDLTSTIVQLYEAGVLRDETQTRPTLGGDSSGYDSATVHVAMLNDRTRTSRFIAGIQEVVSPRDIVADIGTGTGVLAVAAARAGARHVYAIEASSVAKLAKDIFRLNGFADRITLIEGWSTQVTLPEKADVLVSEIVGDEPLAENVLEITHDAIKRFAKPDARLIPAKVRIFGLPVAIPRGELAKHTFVVETLQQWRSWYGIDFSSLVEATRNAPHPFSIHPFLARQWETLGEPVLLADVDFKKAEQRWIDHTLPVSAKTAGLLDGLLEYFELDLGPTTGLSTHPGQVDETNHWLSPVWIFPNPMRLEPGDQFAINYQYRKTEHGTRVSISRL
jgi:protein arginine N-methyltransferase 1